jgi:hypothetical protein
MALGVNPEQTFEALVEDRLNRECTDKNYNSYEILNFAVAGYFSIPHIWVLEEKALRFHPDAVIYCGHSRDVTRIVYWLMTARHENIPITDPFLKDLMQRLSIDEKTPEPIVQKRLSPYAEELLGWTYRRVVEICKEHGIPCYFIMLPMLTGSNDDELNLRLAKEAGFVAVAAKNVYDGHPLSSLRDVEWDGHPNAFGHQLLAREVFELIQTHGMIPHTIQTPSDHTHDADN